MGKRGERERPCHLMLELEVSRWTDDLSQAITLSKHGPTPISPINRASAADLGLGLAQWTRMSSDQRL